MSKITNTTARASVFDLPLLGGSSDAIERMEARGQQELVNSSVLPTKGLQQLADMGIAIGSVVDGDPMFVNVTLPIGWSKRATEHSMWSELIDHKGRVRAKMFYKAAFYDRRANIYAVTRFTVQRDYDRPDYMDVASSKVLEGETVRFTSSDRRMTDADGKALSYHGHEAAIQGGDDECKAWLTEHGYPDFNNPAAYWED